MEPPLNPFDLIRTEDFNTKYEIIAKYFSDPKASYYSNLRRRGNSILVGTRGSGKTMLLKSLYLPVHVEILKKEGKDPLKYHLDFIGVLLNCERYEFKIFRENIFDYQKRHDDKDKVSHFWKQCISHYFALFIMEEMLNTVINHGPQVGLDFSDNLYKDLFDEVCEVCQIDKQNIKSSSSFILLGVILKEKRKNNS